MSFNFRIPKIDKTNLEFSISAGQNLFVLGANGSGKSSLMHHFFSAYPDKCRRISAHRQTWFSSSSITLSPEQKRNTETSIKGSDHSPQSRWKDDYSAHRASIAIYDLIDAENIRARSIASAVDAKQIETALARSKVDAPIKVINELLKLSNIPIEISVLKNENVVASRNGGTHYSVAELSDGERNALLIAANVLTVEPGTLVLIDEPERHLHRSITSPLLCQLFAKRPDCTFIISTHDVSLALDSFVSNTLLIRDCRYENSSVSGWDTDLLSSNSTEIDDEIKRDILGSRRSILFVEGTDRSLDQQLYRIIFPNVSIIPKNSCKVVEQSVTGVRETDDLHWVNAFGIIDNDNRPSTEIESLKAKGIFALSSHSVESVYYHPEIQSRLAVRQISVIGGKAEQLIADAKAALITAISQHIQRLCERVAERAIRESFFRQIPSKDGISKGTPISINFDIKEIVDDEKSKLNDFIKKSDISSIIARYPIRETPALKDIAIKLGFQNREQYENAVRKMLLEDKDCVEFVRSIFGSLFSEISK